MGSPNLLGGARVYMVVVNYGVELESRDQSVPNRRMRVYMVVSVMGWNQSLYGSLKLYGGARVCGVGVRAYGGHEIIQPAPE